VNYSLFVRHQAKRDLQRGAKWYEKQRAGLGREFVLDVEATINRIVESPFLYQEIHRNVRRAIAQRFPYGIFYWIEHADIVVFAIVHLHRDPAYWQDRL
jgi:plasmid stabilization system protein ParE